MIKSLLAFTLITVFELRESQNDVAIFTSENPLVLVNIPEYVLINHVEAANSFTVRIFGQVNHHMDGLRWTNPNMGRILRIFGHRYPVQFASSAKLIECAEFYSGICPNISYDSSLVFWSLGKVDFSYSDISSNLLLTDLRRVSNRTPS